MEESILFAKKYLEDLLSFFGLNIDVYASRDEDVIELSIPSTHMNGFLIGQRGETMRSMQYLVCTALTNGGYEFTRVNVDVADYKKGRQERLAHQALEWIDKVKKTDKPYNVQPMNAADRRIVHKVADEHGLSTQSEGYGQDRHVVIYPSQTIKDDDYDADLAVETSNTDEKPDEKPRKKPEKAKDVSEYFEQENPKNENSEQ